MIKVKIGSTSFNETLKIISYRKILLNTNLFSNACGEGDIEAVKNIYSKEPTCINTKGFR